VDNRRKLLALVLLAVGLYITGPQGRIRYTDDFALFLTTPCVTLIDAHYQMLRPKLPPRDSGLPVPAARSGEHQVIGFNMDTVRNGECQHSGESGWLWGIDASYMPSRP
jgi:hypothetical protein